MSLEGKNIISINDLSDSEIERILEVAQEFDEELKTRKKVELLKDFKLFTLFYEPSSRTYFTFREAMRRLGGDWDGILDAQSASSVAKGETIADTVRTFQLVADCIVMRHPWDGAVRLAEQYSSKPLINGGDGAHEHPTQTLVDLYTIRKETGSIKGRVVALCGDLYHARTVHSLAFALARAQAKIRTISLPSLGLPSYVRARLQELGCDLKEYDSVGEALEGDSTVFYRAEATADGVSTRQAARRRQGSFDAIQDFLQELNAVYVTRIQQERFQDNEAQARDVEVLTSSFLQYAPEEMIVLHPLPRKKEISFEIDQDKRAAYFRQMENSVAVRMAILALTLGVKDSSRTRGKKNDAPYVHVPPGTECVNDRCVTNHEDYAKALFYGDPTNKRLARCAYCEIEVPLVAEWTRENIPEAIKGSAGA